MDIKLTGFKREDFPTAMLNGQATALVLVKGAEPYCEVRPGDTVNLAFDDGSVGVVAAHVSIGPMLNYFGANTFPTAMHFAIKSGQDGRAMVDALAKMYPGDAAAIDPRTIFSGVIVSLPPAPSPTLTPTA